MNRENISANSAGRTSATTTKNAPHCLHKERCIVWLPERGAYIKHFSVQVLNGRTKAMLDTSDQTTHAAVYDGDHATKIAEQVMRCHGIRPVIRTHYGQQQ